MGQTNDNSQIKWRLWGLLAVNSGLSTMWSGVWLHFLSYVYTRANLLTIEAVYERNSQIGLTHF